MTAKKRSTKQRPINPRLIEFFRARHDGQVAKPEGLPNYESRLPVPHQEDSILQDIVLGEFMQENPAFAEQVNALFAAVRKEKFEKTNNPLIAWAEFLACRVESREVPEWVLEYFLTAARELYLLTYDAPPEVPNATDARVLEILGFREKDAGQGARRNVFRELRDERPRAIAEEVARYISAGDKLDFALTYAAKDYGVSRSTAIRAWRIHGKEVSASPKS